MPPVCSLIGSLYRQGIVRSNTIIHCIASFGVLARRTVSAIVRTYLNIFSRIQCRMTWRKTKQKIDNIIKSRITLTSRYLVLHIIQRNSIVSQHLARSLDISQDYGGKYTL